MIIWDEETPNKIGRYLVLSEYKWDNKIRRRTDIQWWDGYRWDNIDPRNCPVKWSYINLD